MPDLLAPARERADRRRSAYRADGFWTGDPIDVVAEAAARMPDADAVVDRDAGTVTYARLDALVGRAARRLARAGVGRDVPVLLIVGNDLGSVVAVHAATRVDAVVLVVADNAGPAHIRDVVEGSAVRFAVAPGRPVPDEVTDLLTVIDLEDEASSDGDDVVARRAGDDPSFVLFTSGTTSAPKGVVHSLSTLQKASVNYIAGAELTSDDRIFLISPLSSVTGVLQALFVAPLLTIPVVLEARWHPERSAQWLTSQRCTWYGGPDRLLDTMLAATAAAGESTTLRAVFLGGTMLDDRIVRRAEEEFGIVVLRAYGSSEVPVSTCGRRDDPAAVRHHHDGAPLDDVDVRIGSDLDPTECCIRGPHAFLGYTDPVATAALDDEWFHTGDAAEMVDGHLRIVGRLRDIVIRNGMKIPVAEVESAVNAIDGVRDCAAYSVPDDKTGERLAIAVVADAAIPLARISGALVDAGLPKYKIPEELVSWGEPLPVNANGKIDRKTLADLAAGRPVERAARLG
ncbi:class I adenylate-forming enzyme family protein [uncultured Williamsia sp.]|uniref:class I adenylate-forming enzyme family protein n=1 Tax=uncultured Williamsia sp. TaxID=259311 RepID=UPI002638064A|nr:class I adenylate-forming enzyme family protein [uncultured Williamsia sp.]